MEEYSRNPPRNPRELFKNCHSSLCICVECAFGVLKKRFPIIQTTIDLTFGITTQKEIIIACCILHNNLMGVDLDQNLIDEVQHELANERYSQERHQVHRKDTDDIARVNYR